ncbi:hypothetical protein BGW80DRAFT_150399 [Lactifluus volemus]|nr:hypothetical protein BGW80DRAFT_150399 [Lactifluus volemus]
MIPFLPPHFILSSLTLIRSFVSFTPRTPSLITFFPPLVTFSDAITAIELHSRTCDLCNLFYYYFLFLGHVSCNLFVSYVCKKTGDALARPHTAYTSAIAGIKRLNINDVALHHDTVPLKTDRTTCRVLIPIFSLFTRTSTCHRPTSATYTMGAPTLFFRIGTDVERSKKKTPHNRGPVFPPEVC